ncbi:MAG: 3-dehydroquinate synthase [Prevotellaceae bacterium]|jgi:3-dehydroquinate synthase|nr:3-dehydroquinate synthase [Prevotellaceae bacterium]
MKEISLHKSRILIGEAVANVHAYLPSLRVVIITDSNVRKCYGALCDLFPVIEIEQGEPHKTLATIDYITSELVRLEADRKTFILGVGGGIVCDVAGFAASIFMRGLPFGFISTTLLSQVDASVGGKNGVNYKGYKNMLGVFAQPQFVICDPQSMATLPQKELASGFAEVVKAAMIANASLFDYIEENAEKILQKDPQTLEHLVYEAVKIKADIVAVDEREQSERRKLNLGHTFAHAIEKNATLTHGEAVSVGLCKAARLAVMLGMMSVSEQKRVENILQRLTLPTAVDIPSSTLCAAIRKDKKKMGDDIHLALPVGIGRCEIRKMALATLSYLMTVDKPAVLL